MKSEFSATLTGSDGPVNGIVKHTTYRGFKDTYTFTSLDDTLHLIIYKNESNKWVKIDGTEPSFFGWVDELGEQIAKSHK